ncbi:MAG: hypothetical protein PHE86_03125 [Candidatus Marinimicrobia bacterium]|nr:hypothetical protein [Candidatus Neomarinimicrobiota bacterium]MDD5582751.1 hypothetical protein [Candidatus Neomarinimicrobiota bacterium]
MYTDVFGAWVAVFFTLAIFSYLYKDNPFYKFAEHVYVGVSAAHWATIAFWSQVQPNLFGRLWPQVDPETLTGFNVFWYKIYNGLTWISDTIFPENGIPGNQSQNFTYIIPLILGIFMLLRLVPKIGWVSRWALAYVVGMAAGLRLYGYLSSDVLSQIQGTILPVWTGNLTESLNNIVIIVGVVCGLFYFFFSVEHKGVFGKISRVGVYFLMITFGASFGFAVMGRISLLIGRFKDLIEFSGKNYGYATFVILIVMVVTLVIISRKDKEVAE